VDNTACNQVGPYHISIDVYSFSIIIYELATGELAATGLGFPPEQYDHKKLALAIRDGERPTINDAVKRCGDDLVQLLKDCWSPDRASRPTFDIIKVRKNYAFEC
jgi:hypothetical protein